MTKQIIAVCLMALVTYIPRSFPIVVFRKKLKSKFIRSFLYYVPYAVLGAMTFPSILYSTNNMLSATIGMIVALILAYLEKGLMTVATCAVVAVYLVSLISS